MEISVMVIGGAAVLKGKKEEEKEVEIEGIGKGSEVLKTEAFWSDLKGFLVQRLNDDGEGERVWGLCRRAVQGGR